MIWDEEAAHELENQLLVEVRTGRDTGRTVVWFSDVGREKILAMVQVAYKKGAQDGANLLAELIASPVPLLAPSRLTPLARPRG